MTGRLKGKLARGEVVVGPLVTLGSPEVTEILSEVGFDYLWLEMEHAPASVSTIQSMVQAAAGRCPCVVRVPWNDPVWIKRVLDTGCEGVVVPQVKSATEAEAAVAACRYPPAGIRSVGIARAQKYGNNLQGYVDIANDHVVVIVQVEHIQAVEKIDEIVSVSGVDAILLGPYDLSASMGVPGKVTNPDVQAAMMRVKDACHRASVPVGVFVADSTAAVSKIAEGFKLIALGADSLYLTKAAQGALSQVR